MGWIRAEKRGKFPKGRHVFRTTGVLGMYDAVMRRAIQLAMAYDTNDLMASIYKMLQGRARG